MKSKHLSHKYMYIVHATELALVVNTLFKLKTMS